MSSNSRAIGTFESGAYTCSELSRIVGAPSVIARLRIRLRIPVGICISVFQSCVRLSILALIYMSQVLIT